MEIKKIVTYEYKTKDGKIFTDEHEAYKHECELVVRNLEKHSIEVGEYNILVINTKEELMALREVKRKTDIFVSDIEKIDKFPCYICVEHDDDCYYYYYKEISKVIDYYEDIINKLKEITKDN